MSIDERRRHELHEQPDRILGTDEAATLMAHLPPVGWADVARKADLNHLDEVLTLRMEKGFAQIRTEMALLRADIHQELRHQLWGILGGLWGSVLLAVVANQVLS